MCVFVCVCARVIRFNWLNQCQKWRPEPEPVRKCRTGGTSHFAHDDVVFVDGLFTCLFNRYLSHICKCVCCVYVYLFVFFWYFLCVFHLVLVA